jgi:hypothetical protein
LFRIEISFEGHPTDSIPARSQRLAVRRAVRGTVELVTAKDAALALVDEVGVVLFGVLAYILDTLLDWHNPNVVFI